MGRPAAPSRPSLACLCLPSISARSRRRRRHCKSQGRIAAPIWPPTPHGHHAHGTAALQEARMHHTCHGPWPRQQRPDHVGLLPEGRAQYEGNCDAWGARRHAARYGAKHMHPYAHLGTERAPGTDYSVPRTAMRYATFTLPTALLPGPSSLEVVLPLAMQRTEHAVHAYAAMYVPVPEAAATNAVRNVVLPFSPPAPRTEKYLQTLSLPLTPSPDLFCRVSYIPLPGALRR